VFAAWGSTAIPIELAVGIQVVRLEVAIDTFAPWARCTSSGSRLDHHQRGLVFLGNLRRRKPRLLQRGVLAEQCFLQRSSHTLSLQPVKFAATLAVLNTAAIPRRAMPGSFESIKVVTRAREPASNSVASAAV
jgi:hypothetical protein